MAHEPRIIAHINELSRAGSAIAERDMPDATEQEQVAHILGVCTMHLAALDKAFDLGGFGTVVEALRMSFDAIKYVDISIEDAD